MWKDIIKSGVPSPILKQINKIYSGVKSYIRPIREAQLIKLAQERHLKKVIEIRSQNRPLRVVFFALMDSVWKYDELYRLMERDERFIPVILVCPIVNYGKEDMLRNMNKCYNLFKNRGYNVIRAYDETTNIYIDVRKELSPDVIFYTNPYEGLIDERYFIKKFSDILTCYVTYSISESNRFDIKFSELFSNLLWRYYIEYPYLSKYAERYSRIGGHNCVYLGFPGIDRFIKAGETFKYEWPIKHKDVKKIIWAPHHTIDDYVFIEYSTFLFYYEFMLDMAEKYRHRIQIAFKPHPLLWNRLLLRWGEEKTRKYYEKWANLSNGIVSEGPYEDLFMTSDAMIHDCGSFIGEYLYTHKPAMFLSNGKSFNERYNEFAQKCLDNYYIGKCKEDIENFILNVINDKDPLKTKRMEFFRNELLPPNGKMASENIIDDLVTSLDLNRNP